MPKTREQLLEVAELLRRDATFADFPDGVSWEDVAQAEKLLLLLRANEESDVR